MLTSLVANLVSVGVVIAVAVVIGFRSNAAILAWAAVVAIVVVFTLALTWLAVAAGLIASSAEGASAFAYPLVFLPFISSAFVPTDDMAGPVKWFADNQPITSIVNTLRDLLADQTADELWVALAWCVGLLVVAYALAMRAYRRKLA